jgi:transcriptional regulator with XRE-family HTH domain
MKSTIYMLRPAWLALQDTNPSPYFGENVRRHRKAAGLTQEELGELSGLDRAYISGVERAVRNPTVVSVEKIAGALHIPPGKLFEQAADY